MTITLARWLLDADAQMRVAALVQEQEHIAARDRLLSLFGMVLLILMQWNLSLHWQVLEGVASASGTVDAAYAAANGAGAGFAAGAAAGLGASAPMCAGH